MRRSWIVLITVLIVATAAWGAPSGSVSASKNSDAAAAKKKCKAGYHRVHGKCKKKKPVAPAPTPTPTTIPGVLYHPDELALDSQGNIYVTEGFFDGTAARVLKLSPTGQLLTTLAMGGSGSGQFNGPGGIALDAQGNVYVADFFNDRIQKLSPTGQVLAVWGTSGSGPGQFSGPFGVALDAQGNIYVTNFGRIDGSVVDYRIQKLSSTGQEVAVWGALGSGPGQLRGPTGLAADAQGNLFVVDDGNKRIHKFSSTGKELAVWGTPGIGPGQFSIPHAVALDAQGDIYVTDRDLNRILKLSPTGQALAVWDSKDYALQGMNRPGFSGDFPVWI